MTDRTLCTPATATHALACHDDLVTALEEAQAVLRVVQMTDRDGDPIDEGMEDLEKVKQKVRDAIAKAKGGS